MKIIARNKRASFDFFIMEKLEAGIELQGTEVKVLRLGKVTFNDAHAQITPEGEIFLYQLTIPQYSFGNLNNHAETRKRKLLLHKDEILKLQHRMKSEHLTLIPLSLYFKNSLVKLELGLAKGKKNYDKRQDLKEKSDRKSVQDY